MIFPVCSGSRGLAISVLKIINSNSLQILIERCTAILSNSPGSAELSVIIASTGVASSACLSCVIEKKFGRGSKQILRLWQVKSVINQSSPLSVWSASD